MSQFLPENEDKLFIIQSAIIFFIAFVVLFSFALMFGWLPNELGGQEKRAEVNYENNAAELTQKRTVGSINPSTGEVQYEYKPISYDREDELFGETDDSQMQENREPQPQYVVGTTPDAVRIPDIDLNWKIEKPSSPHIDTLNDALDIGPVYYPGSGFVEQGNIFLFGHSSYLPLVTNKAYKAFNDIQKLSLGDEIYIDADGKTYVYTVTKVELKDADDAEIKLDQEGRKLTLSTCNVFGQKSDRWVVDADFSRVL